MEMHRSNSQLETTVTTQEFYRTVIIYSIMFTFVAETSKN